METKEIEFIINPRSSSGQLFDKRLIAHVVELVRQGVPRRDVISEFGMSPKTLSNWLSQHGYRSGRRCYTASQKRSVVRAIASGMCLKEARIAFDISSTSVIKQWIKDFKEEKSELSLNKPVEMAKKTVENAQDLELKALRAALEEAHLKIRALDTLIDIAQDQLKIDIRKKSGARQSSK